jgi:hypothetical protein
VSGNRDITPLLCCHGCAAANVGKIPTLRTLFTDPKADDVSNDSSIDDVLPAGPVRAARDQAVWHICFKDDILK